MKTLFLIPARGGSKGIPRKNIELLQGKPLIYYTIDAARELAVDEDICLSTDNCEIIRIGEDYGLKVPFIRPPELASDIAGTYEVCLHAINYYLKRGREYEILVILQPTSPFRRARHIREAIQLFKGNIDMIVSVKETKANPYFVLFEENEKGFLEKSKKNDFIRRQDCPQVWELNGAIYVIRVKSLLKGPIHRFKKVKKYQMDKISSIDIDDHMDWVLAESVLANNINYLNC